MQRTSRGERIPRFPWLSDWIDKQVRKLRKASIIKRDRYIFTDKKHPLRGILSTVLGVIAAVALIYGVHLVFLAGGKASRSYALGLLFTLFTAVYGLVLGILSRREKDIFNRYPDIGIGLNALVILAILMMVLSGVL